MYFSQILDVKYNVKVFLPEHIKNLSEGFDAEQKVWNGDILELCFLCIWEVHLGVIFGEYTSGVIFHIIPMVDCSKSRSTYLWFPYCLNQLGII